MRHPDVYQLDQATAPNVRTPDWAKDAIWYQVMVERFRDGSPVNNHDPFVLGPSLGTNPVRGKGKTANPSTNTSSLIDITAETCKACKSNFPTSSLWGERDLFESNLPGQHPSQIQRHRLPAHR